MVVVPLAASENQSARPSTSSGRIDSRYWVRVAAAGTALVILDQREAVRRWWSNLPGYLEEVQSVLGRVQGAVDELAVQGERLRNVLER